MSDAQLKPGRIAGSDVVDQESLGLCVVFEIQIDRDVSCNVLIPMKFISELLEAVSSVGRPCGLKECIGLFVRYRTVKAPIRLVEIWRDDKVAWRAPHELQELDVLHPEGVAAA